MSSFFNNISWRLLLLIIILFSILSDYKLFVSGQCLTDQRDLLLQLNQSLSYSDLMKRSSWSLNTDCCSVWDGVTCDKDGHVIGLDFSGEYIHDRLDNSSSLFKLQHLQNLNLSYNSFQQEIPSGFDRLANLTHLDLSHSGFSGQIPIEISRLARLVSLDLSFFKLELDDPDLGALIRNLSELRVLRLDEINIATNGRKWGRAISSSLPKLQVLSLSYCKLSGPIHKSLAQLRSLSEIRLDSNNISAQVPDFFVEFSNLTSLSLSDCGLYGKFPEKILQLPTLQSLNLADNELLHGSLPEFPQNGLLQKLVLMNTNFSGKIPNSIGNLKLLSYLDLGNCGGFNGELPNSIGNLKLLSYLDLGNCGGLNGSIPASMTKLDQLQFVDLSSNRLTGPIPPLFWNKNFVKLRELHLSKNSLNGSIPPSLFTLPSLEQLNLSQNQLTGRLETSYLRSSNLNVLPDFFRDQSILSSLDLSSNQIRGKVPNWIWMSGRLRELNLSNNFLEDLEQPLLDPTIIFNRSPRLIVDLSSNLLQGKNLSPLPSNGFFLDYSNNNFSGVIPYNISSYLSKTYLLSLSSNNLIGKIPTSICKCFYLDVLDLSNNNLSGPIPPCLGTMTSLSVLNLGGNKFNGTIPHMFRKGCRLNTFSLNNNRLVGKVARSLANCKMLRVLDLGNNQIKDTFPSWLGKMSKLRVLILRSNRFHGPLRNQRTTDQSFQMLQIIDISFNNFTGNLSLEFFSGLKAMMKTMMINKEDEDDKTSDENQILRYGGRYGVVYVDKFYYNSVTVTIKGQKMNLPKILTIFTSIDMSNNEFEGDIPEVLGSLSSLHYLTISQNALTGRIPSSFGNLTNLESLDLSHNKLSGEIPNQLARLTFLSFLNLSYNHLVGKIPFSTQIQSFNATFFEGNDGLCGPPLTKNCTNNGIEPPIISPSPSKSVNEFNWMPVSV